MITTFNLFTSISWIITGIISAVLSFLFLRKNPSKRLNQLFATGFVLWSLSLIANGINFSIAYYSLIVANVFRDLSVVFGIVGFFCLFLAAFGIYYGPNVLTWVTYVTVGVVAITLSIVGLLNDWVTHDLMGGFKTTDNIYGKLATQIIPAIFVIVSNILLILTYRSTKLPNAKKRIGYFTLGYSTIILGLLFFVIDTFLSVSPYIFPILALCTWVLGPFLVLFGFYTKPDTTPQNIFYQTLPEETVINIDVK